MDGLRLKLESQGLKDVAYMVVNQQGEQAQRLHAMLAQRLSVNITLYQQAEQQPDVWQALGGEKDDFFVYDRCGRLTHHIALPYSVIGSGHVEGAVRAAYCSRACGECTHESVEIPEECAGKADARPEADAPPAAGDVAAARGHDHGHHHHGHGHGHHGHGHHGANHGVHPHGQEHHHGHQHGDHDGQQAAGRQAHERGGGVVQKQHSFELGELQEAAYVHQMQKEAHGADARP